MFLDNQKTICSYYWRAAAGHMAQEPRGMQMGQLLNLDLAQSPVRGNVIENFQLDVQIIVFILSY
jgi:hypothetical protein